MSTLEDVRTLRGPAAPTASGHLSGSHGVGRHLQTTARDTKLRRVWRCAEVGSLGNACLFRHRCVLTRPAAHGLLPDSPFFLLVYRRARQNDGPLRRSGLQFLEFT